MAFDQTVDYDIEFVGGIKTALFGGEGLFFASMTGPGRVWVQTLPFSRLADRIIRAHRGDKEEVKRDFGGTLGALGDLIGGDLLSSIVYFHETPAIFRRHGARVLHGGGT